MITFYYLNHQKWHEKGKEKTRKEKENFYSIKNEANKNSYNPSLTHLK